MPKFTLTDEQIADLAAFVHTFRAAGYDESRVKPPSIIVGNAGRAKPSSTRNAAPAIRRLVICEAWRRSSPTSVCSSRPG